MAHMVQYVNAHAGTKVIRGIFKRLTSGIFSYERKKEYKRFFIANNKSSF